MQLLHSPEEIYKYDRMSDLAKDLEKLSDNYANILDVSVIFKQAKTYQAEVQSELNKYNHLIGRKVSGKIHAKYTSN